MNKRQRAKKDSYDRVANFNSRHTTLLHTIDGYAAEIQLLNDAVRGIEAAIALQLGGATKNAASLLAQKISLAKLVVRYAGKAAVKATQLGLPDLAGQFGVTETAIYKATHADALARCQNIHQLIVANLGTLTNMQPADLAAISGTIAAFEAAKDKPVEYIRQRKALATSQLPGLLRVADNAIVHMCRLLASMEGNTFALLLAELRSAKVLLQG